MRLQTPLILCVLLVAAPALAGSAPATACDRECLRGLVTRVLHAFVEHDADSLPVAPNLRVTEDAVEKPLAQVGLVRSVTRLRGYRQDVIDERAGQIVTGAMVEEAGAPVLLVVRVKADGERIAELELVATRCAWTACSTPSTASQRHTRRWASRHGSPSWTRASR
jgi:hypothetical protein